MEHGWHLIRYWKLPIKIENSVFSEDATKLIEVLGITKPVRIFFVEGLNKNRDGVFAHLKGFLEGDNERLQKISDGYCFDQIDLLFRYKGSVIYIWGYVDVMDEINRREPEILATLAHELFHVYQAEHGRVGRKKSELEAEAFSAAFQSAIKVEGRHNMKNVGTVIIDHNGEEEWFVTGKGGDRFKQLYLQYKNEFFQ